MAYTRLNFLPFVEEKHHEENTLAPLGAQEHYLVIIKIRETHLAALTSFWQLLKHSTAIANGVTEPFKGRLFYCHVLHTKLRRESGTRFFFPLYCGPVPNSRVLKPFLLTSPEDLRPTAMERTCIIKVTRVLSYSIRLFLWKQGNFLSTETSNLQPQFPSTLWSLVS